MTVCSPGYRFIIILLALVYHTSSFAQKDKLDSLRGTLPDLRDSVRVDCLNAISEVYRSLLIFDSAKIYALKAVAESEKIRYALGQGEAYYQLASVEYEVSEFKASGGDCKISIGYFEKLNANRRLGKSYVLLGKAIWAQSQFDQAKEFFSKATQLFIRGADSAELGKTYSLLALEEEERGNYEASLQYALKSLTLDHDGAFTALGQLYADVGDYESALDYYAGIRDRNLKVYNYLKVGETYFLKKGYDSALHYYQLYIQDRSGFPKKFLSKPYALLGGLNLELKNYDTALFYLKSALNDFKAVNNRNWIMRVLLELGRTYQRTGNTTLAIETTRELLLNSEETGARQYTRDAHFLLFELFDLQKKKDSAFEHLKQYTALHNSMDIDISARKLAFYKMAHEKEQAQLKIDLLNNQKQLQQEELKQTAMQRKFLFIGILALMLIGVVLVRNILLKKRNEGSLRELAEHELRIQKLESKKQLGELEMQVLRTQMNPHFIFNSLNSINRFILRNNKEQASEYLTKFSMLVRMILQNSRNPLISLEKELESLELYLSLEALRFDNHFSYTIKVHDDLYVSELNVPPMIIQPYAENAVWHGLMNKEEKGHLHIEALIENGFLCIIIRDDGIGREKAASLAGKSSRGHKSMGLGITLQRIAMMHEPGSQETAVTINDLVEGDGKPSGTEVIIKFPVIYD